MWKMCLWEKLFYIVANILINIKYENMIWKSSAGILLYFVIAPIGVQRYSCFVNGSWKVKWGKFKKDLLSQYSFVVWFN